MKEERLKDLPLVSVADSTAYLAVYGYTGDGHN